MRNAVMWFTEAKCATSKIKPSEEIGLKLPYWTFAIFTYLKKFVKAREEMRQKLWTNAS